MKILVTGGTVFVSRYMAEYYSGKGHEVYVLNRNTRPQPPNTTLIQADRHDLENILRPYNFDLVIDTAYTARDVNTLLDALSSVSDYILISSSAVYPETALLKRVPGAYVLRPPYLYGPMNNVYREAFVFDCASLGRKFYLPGDGSQRLQFFHIRDLCRFAEVLLLKRPGRHIFNVGNRDAVSVREWAELCYRVLGKEPEFVNVRGDVEQRNYFCFYDYEYMLDVTEQYVLMDSVTDLEEGLREAWEWYRKKGDKVNRKQYFEYIDRNLPEILEDNKCQS